MAEGESDAEKTEEPTPQRLQKAREQGQILSSTEMFVFGGIATGTALTVLLFALMPQIVRQWTGYLRIEGDLDALMLQRLSLAWGHMLLFGLAAAVPVLLVVLLLQGGMGGLRFSPEALGFKFEKLNPLQGLARMVSMQAVVNLVKSVAKVAVLGAIAVSVLRGLLPQFAGFSAGDPMAAAGVLADGVVALLGKLTLGLLAIGALDLVWQWRRLTEQLMMTKDEVRRESKEQNGSPELKGKIRQKQIAASRRASRQRKALGDVPQATAIVTNPTHFAVALRYVPGETDAPVIVAMGQGPIAQEIMATGRKAGIHVLQLPPLARALYFTGEIGDQIPDQLFAAVAVVLAHVYRLDRGDAADLPDIDLPQDMRFNAHGRPEATS